MRAHEEIIFTHLELRNGATLAGTVVFATGTNYALYCRERFHIHQTSYTGEGECKSIGTVNK